MKPFRQLIVFLLVSSLLSPAYATSPPTGGGTPSGGGGLSGLMGTLNSVLGNLGSIQAAWGALEGLFSGDFSFTKLLDAACKSATAAEGVATSEGSSDVQDYTDVKEGVCGLSQFLNDIEAQGDDMEAIIRSFNSNIFGSVITTAQSLGANVTTEQAQEWQTTINDLLAGKAREVPEGLLTLFEGMMNTKRQNNQTAPNGSSAAVSRNTQLLAPNLAAVMYREEARQALDMTNMGQSIYNNLFSTDITKRIVEDETMMNYHKLNTETVAPDIRKEARTSVSTRATVQEVVNAITRYMEQDSHNITFLSGQIKNQIQQQAITNNQLFQLVQSEIQKSLRESTEQQVKMQQTLLAIQKALEARNNQLAMTLGSFVYLGLPTDTNIAVANGTMDSPITFTVTTDYNLLQETFTPFVTNSAGN